jgi:hypothetical protein
MVETFDPHPILVNVNKFTNSLWFPEDANQGYKGGGIVNKQPKWNEDNQLEVEDDKQPKVDSHLIIVPSEQFFNKELKLNEV